MKTFITIVIIAVLIVLGIYYFKNKTSAEEQQTVYCTLDAMQCPDGSYVGRTPPDCAFAACPATSTTTPGYDVNATINAS